MAPPDPVSPVDSPDLSKWEEQLWEEELDYEVRALKLVTRCAREEDNLILCGDKSGRIYALSFAGKREWSANPWEEEGHPFQGGPVYDLAVVHPISDAAEFLDLDCNRCLIAVGAGNGELRFLDYRRGRPALVEFEEGPRACLNTCSSILTLLYIESSRELWVGLASGEIVRLSFDFEGALVRGRLLPSVNLGEAVSSLCFMPRSPARYGDEYRKGWICATTMLGNVYSLDPLVSNPSTQERLLQTTGPIRACVSLSRMALKREWRSDVFAVAYGGAVRYFVRDWPEDARNPVSHDLVLDWRCADRVFCLSWTALDDAVWLVVGANDNRLHLCRVMSGEAAKAGRSPSRCFGDKRFSILLPERVREVAVREVHESEGETEAILYVALGNHRIQALQLLSPTRFRQRIRAHFPIPTLAHILEQLNGAPYNPGLRRNTIALLFRAGWLSEYLKSHPLDVVEARRLRLIIYHLLAGSGSRTAREVLSGLLAIANQPEAGQQEWLRSTTTELARHIGKYCLDGLSFSDKSQYLDRLARFNEQNDRDYLYDAAIYRSLLAERRHTEREVFKLEASITGLQNVEIPALGGQRLLATSYQKGIAWLIEKGRYPRLTFYASLQDGTQAEWLQQVIVWTDLASSAQHAIFFYRDRGWTSCDLSGLNDKTEISLPDLHPIARDERFYIYSFQPLPGGLIAAGGRFADMRLLRISAGHEGKLDLCLGPAVRASDEDEVYAPIRSLCFQHQTGALFAGCDNGSCYRFVFNGSDLLEPNRIYQLPESIRVSIRVLAIPERNPDHLIVGDTSDSLTLLRRFNPSPSDPSGLPTFIPEWMVRLGSAAITGIVQTELLVPSSDAHRYSIPRPVFIVSDSSGKFHVLRLDDVREHSFAEPLDGRGTSPIEQMVLFPAEVPERRDQTQIAVACFDQTVRILRLFHRRESVRHLNDDLSHAAVATLRGALPSRSPEAFEAAQKELQMALDGNLFVAEIVRKVAITIAPGAEPDEIGGIEKEVQGAFDEVAWKFASVYVRSEAPTVMALRLQYDNPESFPRLLDQLSELSAGTLVTLEGKRPHMRLRYCLRFAFKILAYLLDSAKPPDSATLARFVHGCHDLCQGWGPDQSEDDLRCKLVMSHMLFRFATRRTLECLLGDELDEELGRITGRSMSNFLQERLLNDPRLGIPFRTVQHIRRMVEHDNRNSLRNPVVNWIVPLLTDRFRHCLGTHHDAWLGMEIYLCLHVIEHRYVYSQWRLISNLLEHGCPRPLLEFLVERQQVLPPRDRRCQDVVKALHRSEGLSAGDPRVAAARRTLFHHLAGEGGIHSILACVRALTAVTIAFDSSSDLEVREQAWQAIKEASMEAVSLPPSVARDEVEQLLNCSRDLILLSSSQSFAARSELYRSLRRSLDLLMAPLPSATEAGLLDSDVVRRIFLEAREFVRRQVEIEFDFVAPLRFLQEQAFSDTQIADEQMLTQKLLSYAGLQEDLSRPRTTLLLTRDATARAVILDVLGDQTSHKELSSRTQIRRQLKALLPPPLQIEPLQREASRLLDSGSGNESGPRPELFPLSSDLLGEIISIDREGERYSMLFFAYDRTAAPDPSKRALSRMIPQFLISEFMRSVQTQRLLSLTFHHISAPVSAMRVMLKSLTEGYIDPGEREKYFESLWFMAEDCRLMIENQQNYMRIVRGFTPPLQTKIFDIVAEAEFRRKIVSYRYKGSQQMVLLSSTSKVMEVCLDSMMVGDIIQNLLDNACKYSPARSRIRIRIWAGKNKKDVFIEVSDQGPGMPEQVFASLYGEGIRGEAAAQSTRPGLGLGLFMVRRYVEWLDGEIWYDSSPETGTTFTVRLPREAGHQ